MPELDKNKFIQENSPDGGFLQSEEWRKFQESAGRKTYNITGDNFYASIIEHQLPIVGKYFYIPRGPVMSQNLKPVTHSPFLEIIDLAKKNNIGWIRIEPADEEILKIIYAVVCEAKPQLRSRGFASTVKKAPHDMQPREIFVIDISKSEEELLAEMKAKTRYNIKVAQKHGVSLRTTNSYETTNKKDIKEFLRLVKITAERDKITPHPESYYRKMFEVIPGDILKLYVAEYNNKIIAANIVIFYPHTKIAVKESLDKKNIFDKNSNFGVGACGNTATYLHGASDNEYRNVMAPYLLQWQAILDAKKTGLTKYDMGGVKIPKPVTCSLKPEICNPKPDWFKKVTGCRLQATGNSWQGITRFKTGFAPDTKPVEFPGSYDIIINSRKYFLYRFIRKFLP